MSLVEKLDLRTDLERLNEETNRTWMEDEDRYVTAFGRTHIEVRRLEDDRWRSRVLVGKEIFGKSTRQPAPLEAVEEAIEDAKLAIESR